MHCAMNLLPVLSGFSLKNVSEQAQNFSDDDFCTCVIVCELLLLVFSPLSSILMPGIANPGATYSTVITSVSVGA